MNAETRAQFGCAMALGAIFSLVVGLFAMAYVGWGGGAGFHMLLATFLGAGLSTMVGIALMSLVFLSNRSGADADAGKQR